MDFGKALQLLKDNRCVARSGWHGRGMCIFLRPGDDISPKIAAKIKTIPPLISRAIAESNVTVSFTSYICMRLANGVIVNSWLPSQSDVLMHDWYEVETL